MITRIETNRMILRQWNRSDLVPFASINADKQVMKYFPSTLTRSASDEFARRIMTEMSEKGYGLFAAELKSDGRFIGCELVASCVQICVQGKRKSSYDCCRNCLIF